MENYTAQDAVVPFSGEDWFDPLEEAVRLSVRGFIEAMVEQELQSALGGRGRYERKEQAKGYRNGHRERQLEGPPDRPTLSVAERICRTSDWIHPSRVPRSRDHLQ